MEKANQLWCIPQNKTYVREYENIISNRYHYL
ncbi:hypothetical protein KL86DPRO_10997 [uncultured delta proteobacterium]|uniref:Uncharacterized protein n=1 Tax=uncultured delta proteobacterium TaxID=34034 RepID=A0A212J9P9_9DELT|nr:hypothetical protein KL86DPRO_10997 [uncultured delta proteobacterium]